MKAKKFFGLVTMICMISFVRIVRSDAVSNGPDILSIISPEANESISSEYELIWQMVESDREIIPFQAELFEHKCEDNGNKFGIIGDHNSDFEVDDDTYIMSWNSAGPIDGQTAIPDAVYCLRVCAIYIKEGNNFYSLCDKRTIDIDNRGNNSPKITSKVVDLTIKVGNKFTYQVEAEDPDGDKLIYSLERAEDIFEIESETGLMTSKGGVLEVGVYQVKVVVIDGNGGKDSQVFSINVSDDDNLYVIDILSPEEGEDYEDEIELTWKIMPEKYIANIALYYSTDDEEWQEIEKVDGDVREYSWDTSGVQSGDCRIKIELLNTQDERFEKLSDKFVIDHGDLAEETIAIGDLLPAKGSTIQTIRPDVQATFKISEGAEIDIDNVELKLDDKEIDKLLDCDIAQRYIKCKAVKDIEYGRHQLSLKVLDTDGREVSVKWYFTIEEENSEDNMIHMFGRDLPQNTLYLGGGAVCLVLLILVALWMMYYAYRKRRAKSSDGGYAVSDGTISPASTSPLAGGYQPMIGEQTIGQMPASVAQVPEEVYGASSTQTVVSESKMSMPSSYTSDEVPAWLKDFETDTPRKENKSSYQGYSQDDIDTGARVHDEQGLALEKEEAGS